MRNRNAMIRNTGLFEGIEDGEMETMLKCLGAYTRRYVRDDFLFRRGDHTDCLGLVLSGNVREVREDWWGNRTNIADFGPGRLMCTEYACSSDRLDASLVATEPTEVMFLDVNRVTNVCTSSCEFHNRLVLNLVRSMASMSLDLNRRMEQLAKRTTREKVCAFLSDQARAAGSSDFLIGMNRQEMADHLGVDRSAMSAELGRMKRDGIIDFDRNHFVLLRSPQPVPLRRELLQEPHHVVVAGPRHHPGRGGAHHVPQQEELLVEVVHRGALVAGVGLAVHPDLRPDPGDVHEAPAAAPVGEGPGYAHRADGVQPVGVLHDPPLRGVRDHRVGAPERHLVDDADHPLPHLPGDALRLHEAQRVGVAVVAEELPVVGVVQQRRQPHGVHVPALPAAYRHRQVVDADGVPDVVAAAVPLEEAGDESPRADEDLLVHAPGMPAGDIIPRSSLLGGEGYGVPWRDTHWSTTRRT